MATRIKPARGARYEADLAAWAEAQAEALRAGRFDELDPENLAEEIGDLSNRERDAIESHLETLIVHLLKWRYHPGQRSMSWHATIRVARSKIAKLLRRSPSLRRELPAYLEEVYPNARDRAAGETALPYEVFPPPAPSPSTRSPATGCRRSRWRAYRPTLALGRWVPRVQFGS